MPKALQTVTPAEERARIESAIANVRRRSRPQPQPENDNARHDNDDPARAAIAPQPPKTESERKEPSARRSDKGRARDTGDYEVGYGRPPVKTQFKPGQSGNKKGRPKASRNVNTIIKELVFKVREATIDGKKQRLTQLEIGIRQLMNKFMTGDAKAAAQVLTLLTKMQELGGSAKSEGDGAAAVPDLTESGRRMIARHQSDLFREAGLAEEKIGPLLQSLGLPVPEPDRSAGINDNGEVSPDQEDQIEEDNNDPVDDDIV